MTALKQTCVIATLGLMVATTAHAAPYPVPDTGQSLCYGETSVIGCPFVGEALFGQSAQHSGTPMSYTNNGDGTVTHATTGLMWTQGDSGEAMSWQEAPAWVELVNHARLVRDAE